jgi:CheY-like chemotaxis protein
MKQSLLKLVTPLYDHDADIKLMAPAQEARVLIVTQSPAVLAGLRVEHDTCNTLAEAVRLAQSHPYIAVFIDLAELRCRSSGTQIIFALRHANVFAPAVLMSSTASLVDRTHAIRRGATALIVRNAEAIMQILPSFSRVHQPPPEVMEPPAQDQVRKKIIYLMGDFTGLAAEDQAQSVIRHHGQGLSAYTFVEALADFISSSRDRALFIQQAFGILAASEGPRELRSFDDE